MKTIRLLTLAGYAVASLALFSNTAKAQGPLYDKVIVDLPYSVTIKDKTLPPGHYVIRQFQSPSGSRILQVFSNEGMRLEATAQTIAAYDINTPEKTTVVLHHYGTDYYFDKVWVQGKNYGYEFPLPDSVKAREKERMGSYTVAAQYQPEPPAPQVAQAAPPPAPEPAPQPEAAPAPPPQEPAPAPAPETHTMPTTAGNWSFQVAGGALLTFLGLMLRRRRTA